MKQWSNLAKVVYKRTYARKDFGKPESWSETCARVVAGNMRIVRERAKGSEIFAIDQEQDRLLHFMRERKAGPAGRGYWFSGAPAHDRIGGIALNNCWYLNSASWENF